MNKSGIEWCDHTWNPITGCRHGCSYCYADKMSLRFCGNIKRNMLQTGQYRIEGDLFVLDEPFMNEDGKPVIYPFGFEPTLHRYRYNLTKVLPIYQEVLNYNGRSNGMIKILLSKKLGEMRLTQADLARATGIRPNTINELYHELADRVNLEHLDLICEALDCELDELIVRVPNKESAITHTRQGTQKPGRKR